MFVTAVCVLLLLNLDELGYDATNLVSCMTLDVENLHSVVHRNSGVFGSTAKESVKRTTAWSAYYYTSRGSWYPVPERSLGLFEIPSMSQTSVVKASKDEISMMREWARAHVCQTFHQKEIEVGERIDLSSNSVATTDISSVSSITERVYYKGSYIP